VIARDRSFGEEEEEGACTRKRKRKKAHKKAEDKLVKAVYKQALENKIREKTEIKRTQEREEIVFAAITSLRIALWCVILHSLSPSLSHHVAKKSEKWRAPFLTFMQLSL
jgi:hypothetical protein